MIEEEYNEDDDTSIWENLGGEELAKFHPNGWIYVSDGVWVDRDDNMFEF